MFKLIFIKTCDVLSNFLEFIFGSDFVLKFLRNFLSSKNYFITITSRPKIIDNLELNLSQNEDFSSIAIIIQGPLIKKDNFTLYTALLYKKLFRDVLIIISTWEDASKSYINKFNEHSIVLLKNKYPEYYGFNNINLQILSTIKGIEYAKKYNIKYVLKTRTDQRFHSHETLTFLRNLVSKDTITYNKIIIASLNTFKNRLFSISDMFQFGEINTIEQFWSIDLVKKDVIHEQKNMNDLLCIPEIYLVYNYLLKNNYKLDWNHNSYEEALLKYFYIIDKCTIDLFWNKYNLLENYRTYYNKNDGLIESCNMYWHNIYKKRNEI